MRKCTQKYAKDFVKNLKKKLSIELAYKEVYTFQLLQFKESQTKSDDYLVHREYLENKYFVQFFKNFVVYSNF